MDKIKVAKMSYTNPLELLCVLIEYYYIFNRLYHHEVSLSLEFIVRYYGNYSSPVFRGQKTSKSDVAQLNRLIKRLLENEKIENLRN